MLADSLADLLTRSLVTQGDKFIHPRVEQKIERNAGIVNVNAISGALRVRPLVQRYGWKNYGKLWHVQLCWFVFEPYANHAGKNGLPG